MQFFINRSLQKKIFYHVKIKSLHFTRSFSIHHRLLLVNYTLAQTTSLYELDDASLLGVSSISDFCRSGVEIEEDAGAREAVAVEESMSLCFCVCNVLLLVAILFLLS